MGIPTSKSKKTPRAGSRQKVDQLRDPSSPLRHPANSDLRLFYLFALFQTVIALLWFAIDHRPPRWDESTYLNISEYSFQHLKTFHLIQALDLHEVTNTKPGLIPFLTAISYFVVGHSVRVAALLVNLGSVWTLGYSLIAMSNLLVASPWPGLLGSLWFCLFETVMVFSGYYQVDLPLAAISALTVLLCVRLDRGSFSSLFDSILLGLAIVLGMGAKHLYVVFAGGPLLYFVGRCLFSGTDRLTARLARRWPVLLSIACGTLCGIWYHWLNSHILQEQIARSHSVAATGAIAPAPALWTIWVATLGRFPISQMLIFVAGLCCLAILARRMSWYPLLWIAGGWIGIRFTASFPLSYYFFPLLPGFTLIAATVICFDRVVPWGRHWTAPASRVLAGVLACLAVGVQLHERLGTANPGRLISGTVALMKSSDGIRSNPFVDTPYWQGGVVDGNSAVLPYPLDWKTDEVVGALKQIARQWDAGRILDVRLLTDYEWMSGDLFHYKVLRSGLTGQVAVQEPDFSRLNSPAGATDADVVIAKSGPIFKAGFYDVEWARRSQSVVDRLLENDGALLKARGFFLFERWPLPDHTWATVWVSRERMSRLDLLTRLGSASIEATAVSYVGPVGFDINGDIRRVLFEHPGAAPQITSVRWRLNLLPGARFKSAVGISPESWGPDKSDGVEFEVDVVEDGRTSIRWHRYLDPQHVASDRRWVDVEFPLNVTGHGPIDLILITRAGPRNNNLYDHAGWSDPVILP
jgi:hypothetical protein